MKNLRLFLLAALFVPAACFAEGREIGELKNVAGRIQAANLINAISLSPAQMQYVFNKASEAQEARKEVESEISEHYQDYLADFSRLESEVESGRVVVDKTTEKRFHRSRQKLEELRHGLDMKLDEMAKDIRGQLAEHQVCAIDGFTPCLVPRLQDGRIGQEGGTQMSEMLEKVRSLPSRIYSRRKADIVDRLMRHIEKNVPYLSEEDARMFRTKIEKTFSDVRKMSDMDFAIKKDRIAADLKDALKPDRREVSPEQKIRTFLLTDQAVEVLKKKLGKA
jgi:hypothetical protein